MGLLIRYSTVKNGLSCERAKNVRQSADDCQIRYFFFNLIFDADLFLFSIFDPDILLDSDV